MECFKSNFTGTSLATGVVGFDREVQKPSSMFVCTAPLSGWVMLLRGVGK